jgi:hypothetical protein
MCLRLLRLVPLTYYSMPRRLLLEQIAAVDMRITTTFAFYATLLSFCVKVTPTGADQILAAAADVKSKTTLYDKFCYLFYYIIILCHVTPTYWSRYSRRICQINLGILYLLIAIQS